MNAIPIPKNKGINSSKSISSINLVLKSAKLPVNKGFKKLNFILLIAYIKRSYIPVIRAIVPPDTPGIIFATPISIPFNTKIY